MREFRRVARRRAALLQYERDESDAFTSAYGDIVRAYATDDTEALRRRALAVFAEFPNARVRARELPFAAAPRSAGAARARGLVVIPSGVGRGRGLVCAAICERFSIDYQRGGSVELATVTFVLDRRLVAAIASRNTPRRHRRRRNVYRRRRDRCGDARARCERQGADDARRARRASRPESSPASNGCSAAPTSTRRASPSSRTRRRRRRTRCSRAISRASASLGLARRFGMAVAAADALRRRRARLGGALRSRVRLCRARDEAAMRRGRRST